jgi:ubiquinone/menaquinone biosynthesis C-methylase UbiE
MLDFGFQDQIRAQEIAAAAALCGPTPASLLEIGAGAGVQAKFLADRGYQVKAIDLAGSQYESLRVFPVTNYDGSHIPFPDGSFDVVYSSHVLMHLLDPASFHKEVQRVLKPGGRVVHVVPTSAWRFWTFAMHYPANVVARVRDSLARRASPGNVLRELEQARQGSCSLAPQAADTLPEKLRRWLRLPRRIGETGNVITEHYLFSERGWRSQFRQHGWEPLAAVPNRLFYTGHMALASWMPLTLRRLLSHFLGSAGKVYVLRACISRD